MMAKRKVNLFKNGQILDYPPLDLATPATEKFIQKVIPPENSYNIDKCYRTGRGC